MSSIPVVLSLEIIDAAILEAAQAGGGTVRLRFGTRESEKTYNLDALLKLRAQIAAEASATSGSSTRFAAHSKGL